MQEAKGSLQTVVAASIKWKVETGVGHFRVFATFLLTLDFCD
jgi:hypothetical protein